MCAHDATTDDQACFGIKNQLGHAFIAAIGNGAARSSPREHRFGDFDAIAFGDFFGDAHPCHFWVGIRHAWNHACVKEGFVACTVFSGHMAFVHGFVRQHRLTNNVAYRVNVWHIGALLFIDIDEAAVGNGHACFVCAD